MTSTKQRLSFVLALALTLAAAPGLMAGTLTVRPGVPSNGGSARYTGTHGLEVNVATPDRNPAYVQSSHPTAESTYRARFYVNLRGLTMANGDEFDLFDAYDGADPVPPATAGNADLRLVIRQVAGQKVLSAFARLDGGTESEIASTVAMVNGWRMVEINWARATAAGANNGRLDLWVDGVPRTGLTGLDNDTASINYARWGTVAGVDAGTSGTVKLDDFSSQRTGYMGPLTVFSDEPSSDQFFTYVQGLYAAEITGGCGAGVYCPNDSIPRDQMAVFLVRAMHGPNFVPPAPTGVFADVPTDFWAAAFIEQLFADGITGGCASAPLRYCPGDLVTRAQMAVFLLRGKHGSSYVPPPATGTVFTDVPAGSFAAEWIEQLFAEGITSGCGAGIYCPGSAVSRGQMAVFMIRSFSLPQQMIGP